MQAANPSARQPANAASRIAALLADHPVVILACYFAVQAVIRTGLGAPANLDEGEQLAIADHFSFGYGPHPPLYQWLQTAAFGLFGVNFLAIAIVKNAVLLATWALLVRLGLELTGSRQLAAIAGFGLLFSPNFSWESQIDHTHTVTSSFFVVATALAAFKLIKRKSVPLYALLGICVGFGMMAKYNYALFPAAVFLAFAFDRQARKILASPWLLLSLALALAIAAPHYFYIAGNPATGAAKLSNLAMNRYGFLQTRLAGMTAFLTAAAGVHAVWLGLVGLGWLDARTAPRPLLAPIGGEFAHRSRLLLLLWALVLCLFAGLVLVAGTTSFRDHWLQPAAVFFPLVLAIAFSRYIDETAFCRLALAAAIAMLLIPIVVIANKQLFPGAQRDAYMPDPATIARLEPRIASGQMPVAIAAETDRWSWYCAGHLRYWLQIPTPLHTGGTSAGRTGSAAALVFHTVASEPRSAAAFVAFSNGLDNPQELPWFNPESLPPGTAGRWYLALPK